MASKTQFPQVIGILMPGDMGHAVGAVLGEHGHDIVTCLSGRSETTRNRAQKAGFRDAGSLDVLVSEADLILSILPPASAKELAEQVVHAIFSAKADVIYADCNAVSPQTAKEIAAILTATGAPFIDAGIIGAAPGRSSPPRFYVSGADVSSLTALDGKGISVIPIGDEVGKASAIKMAYAGLTKGTMTLHTAVLLAAFQLGVLDELLDEFRLSQPAALKVMQARTARLPADAERWVGEMEEIAATFRQAGVPDGFHEAAAEIFRILARTPYASETRETIDPNRTLDEALVVFAEHLSGKETS
ncbi:MAG: DUF1932 domain-containing protein [Hyphomicrobiales bacterium]